MVNITHKSNSLRIAVATAVVSVSSQDTIKAVEDKRVPKGDVFEFARAAGLLAIKKTSDVIPDCHPLPVEFAGISYEISGLEIIITVEVHTIYKTGVEVEAMHGASITALTMYDMLKPIDKSVVIRNIQLEKKSGGKSGVKKDFSHVKCGVIVCSDSVSKGESEDIAGKAVTEKLKNFNIETLTYKVIADDLEQIRAEVKKLSDDKHDLLFFVGGTGLSPRDVTFEAIEPLIQQKIPGIMETARRYGQDRMPYAMLSRSIAGFVGSTLIITTPGSKKGAGETIDALFPNVLHVFDVRSGKRH